MAINVIESPSNRSQGLIMHTVHKGKNGSLLVQYLNYLNLPNSEITEIFMVFLQIFYNFFKVERQLKLVVGNISFHK